MKSIQERGQEYDQDLKCPTGMWILIQLCSSSCSNQMEVSIFPSQEESVEEIRKVSILEDDEGVVCYVAWSVLWRQESI